MAILLTVGADLDGPHYVDTRRRRKRDRKPERRTRSLGLLAQRHVHVEHPGVQHGAIPQRGAHRPVQAVLEIDDALPPHRVREEVAVERGVLRQQAVQREHRCRGDQFVEPDLLRRYLGPVPVGQPMLGVRLAVPHALEDHRRDLPCDVAQARRIMLDRLVGEVAGDARCNPTGSHAPSRLAAACNAAETVK